MRLVVRSGLHDDHSSIVREGAGVAALPGLLLGVHGKDENARPRELLRRALGGLEAVQLRHRDVHERHVRTERADEGEGVHAVRTLSRDLDVR